MKTTTIVKVVTVTSILLVNNLSVNAQFFKKLGKAIEKTAKTVESTANALDEVSKAADATPSTASSLTDGGTAAASDSVSIAWDKIPVFSAKRVNMTDENGNPVLLDNSSMPHAVPSGKRFEPGDFLTLDFGCKYNGYCSDMTRTIVIGKANEEQKKIYNIVLRANLEAEQIGRASCRERVSLAG